MRHRAFPGRGPETEARYQRAGQWLLAAIYHNDEAKEWCKANGVAVVKAAGETVGGNGGFIVPRDLANAILDIRDSYGAFRRRARLVPMASDITSVPRRTGGASAFFIGENTASTETSASLDDINLTARKIGSLFKKTIAPSMPRERRHMAGCAGSGRSSSTDSTPRRRSLPRWATTHLRRS